MQQDLENKDHAFLPGPFLCQRESGNLSDGMHIFDVSEAEASLPAVCPRVCLQKYILKIKEKSADKHVRTHRQTKIHVR